MQTLSKNNMLMKFNNNNNSNKEIIVIKSLKMKLFSKTLNERDNVGIYSDFSDRVYIV